MRLKNKQLYEQYTQSVLFLQTHKNHQNSNVTNRGHSLTDYFPVVTPHLSRRLAKKLRKGPSDSHDHQHWEKQSSENAHDSLLVRKNLKGKTAHSCKERHEGHAQVEEEVPGEEQKQNHRNEQSEKQNFEDYLDDRSAAAIVKVAVAATSIAVAAITFTAFTFAAVTLTFKVAVSVIVAALAMQASISVSGVDSGLRNFHQLSILIVITVVSGSPIRSADIAELIFASTGHMVAPLIFLNHKPTFLALSVVQIILKKQYFLLVTLPLMNRQKTLPAKLLPALFAKHPILDSSSDNSFAILLRTQFSFGVFGRLLKLSYFFVFFLDIGRQVLEEWGIGVEHNGTIFMGTVDLLEIVDLVYDVVVQTGLTKTVLMLALAHIHVFGLLFAQSDLSVANQTIRYVLYFVYGAHQTAPHHATEFGLVEAVFLASGPAVA